MSGSARPVAPIRISPDRRHLVDGDGAPFFWLGDTAWELFHRLDRDDALRYLDDRAAKGFTVIQAVAHGRIMTGWATEPNRYGHPPYLDGDVARPDPAFFSHVDWVIERALDRGIRTALLPVWGSAVVVGERRLNAGNAEEYGRFLGERYRDAGIIWVLGGDTSVVHYAREAMGRGRNRRRPLEDFRPVYDALAAGIRQAAGDDAFFTYHPSPVAPAAAPSPLTSDYFGDRPWFSLNMLQSSHGDADPASVDARGGILAEAVDADGVPVPMYWWAGLYNYLPVGLDYRSTPTRPVVDGEPCYEDHPFIREAPPHGIWLAADVRIRAYHALFAGAAGHTYGHVSLWDFYGSGGFRDQTVIFYEGFWRPDWDAGLGAPGSSQMVHARRLMESRPWFDSVPDDAVILGDPGEGAEHVNAIRGTDRSWAFVYLPRGGAVTVDLGLLSGPGPVWWFDPRTGAASRAGDHAGAGSDTYAAPGAGIGQDWVLVLDDAARGYAEPGGTGEGARP